jgi:tetratricopeptide (TPR) repeat protein
LRQDDRHAVALAGLGQTHISDTMCRWSADPMRQVGLADAAANLAIEINPRLAFAYHVRGLVSRVRQQSGRAIAAFDMAVQLNPSLAPAHAELGFSKQALAGSLEGLTYSLDGFALARRISPREPVLANWLYGVGVGFLKCGENETAIRWLNESIGLNPLPPALAYLAAAYALDGDEARARSALMEFKRRGPGRPSGHSDDARWRIIRYSPAHGYSRDCEKQACGSGKSFVVPIEINNHLRSCSSTAVDDSAERRGRAVRHCRVRP